MLLVERVEVVEPGHPSTLAHSRWRAPYSTTGRGGEGAGDEMVQFAQIERLVQIAECPLDQRVGLLPTFPVSAHHEDRRFHARVADALQQVEALSSKQGVASFPEHSRNR